jgi:hypothetical protein
VTLERAITFDRSLAVARVYLVPNGWPYYRASGIEIPFEPRARLAAVALARRVTDPEVAKLRAEAEKIGFTRVTVDSSTGAILDDVNRSVLYFEPKDAGTVLFSFDAGAHPVRSRVSPQPIFELKALFSSYAGRVGSASSMQPGEVRIIDNQYLIRFREAVTEDEVRRFVNEISAALLRSAGPNWPYWLIGFSDPQNLGRHLHVIEQQVRSGVLASGEPNLLFQLKPTGPQIAPLLPVAVRNVPRELQRAPGTVLETIQNLFCGLKPDDDPYERCQYNLSRQRVEEAWCYVGKHVEGARYGLPSVLVATIDDGITFDSATSSSTHTDVDSGRIGFCYDLEFGQACSEGSVHGMGVYGIISAKPDNDFGITGIAPNATHIAIDASVWTIQATERYARILLWTGGLAPLSNDDPGAGIVPPPQPSVINCSHSLESHPFPESLGTALTRLTTEGRGGLGIVVVYAAGNRDRYLGDQNDLATHPCTIGVGNTEILNDMEVRQYRAATNQSQLSGSNFGPFIDLCANGENAPSLLPTDDEVGPACEEEPDSGRGVYTSFGGTSAAAAMVSGAVALILTINPQLNWKQVRQILCASAEKIDCENTTDELQDDLPRKGKWRPCNQGLSGPQPSMPCGSVERGLDWFSDFYGYGRLDVYEAVKLARTTLPAPPTCDLG